MQSKVMKALTILLTAGASSIGLQPALAASHTSGPEVFQVYTDFTPDTARGKVLQQLVNRYNKQHAGKVKFVLDLNSDWPAMQQKIRTMIAANQTPDLFIYNFNPNDLSMQTSGRLMDFTPYVTGAWKATFPSSDIQTLTIKGKLMSVPFDKTPVNFFYNKSLFAKAGIKSFPKTWPEFFADCAKLKKKGITPISLMTADDAWLATNAFTYFAASIGGPNVFNNGKTMNSPAIVQAATMLQKLFSYTTQDAVGANYAVGTSSFTSGRTAMIINGPWFISSVDSDMKHPSDVAMAPAPTEPGGKGKPGLVVTDALTPWAAAKEKTPERSKDIADFLKYLTSPASAKDFLLHGQEFLSTKTTISSAELKSANPLLAQDYRIFHSAPQTVVNVSRILKPAALNQLPKLLEALALKQITPAQFTQQLQQANSQP
ncbi:MAG: extracellular solute-binding protein [Alicyclobacillus sp.]|nr:extracellular solute-binding protein [Alicyclobacillus sp.]